MRFLKFFLIFLCLVACGWAGWSQGHSRSWEQGAVVAYGNPIEGSWRWSWAAKGEKMTEHGEVTFSSDGTMKYNGSKSGTWKSSAGGTTYRLDWEDGGWDSMTLDGETLKGKNQLGWDVEGHRD